MKKIYTVALALALTIVSINGVQAQEATPTPEPDGIDAICRNVTTLPNRTFIYKNSAPLRSGGVGTPLIGYRNEPTLICNARNGMSKGWTKIYDREGTRLSSCPWATAHGHSGGRYRCTINTASLRRKAVKNTGVPVIFIKTGAGKCVKVPDAGRCYGSVKGRCNQVIK